MPLCRHALAADQFPCHVCSSQISTVNQDEPTLLDAVLLLNGQVQVSQPSAGLLAQRRVHVTRMLCPDAREAALGVRGQEHYLCEEHLQLLVAQQLYLKCPVEVCGFQPRQGFHG